MKKLFLVVFLIHSMNIFAAELTSSLRPNSRSYNQMFYFKVMSEGLKKYVGGSPYVFILPSSYVDSWALIEGDVPNLDYAVLRVSGGVGYGFTLTDASVQEFEEVTADEYSAYTKELEELYRTTRTLNVVVVETSNKPGIGTFSKSSKSVEYH